MKYMVLMIPGVYHGNKAHEHPPTLKDIEQMGRFNDEMAKSLKMTDALGLQPLTKGARVTFKGGKASVTDGPFVEAKEVLGGFWMLEANSKEEVVNWMKKCPANPEDIIEIRQVFDVADFQ